MSAALERRARAAVDGEAGAGDLGAGGEVEHAERLGDLPVGLAALVRRRLAPGADDDAGLLAADRDVRVGRVGDAQQQVVELGLEVGDGVQARGIRSPRCRGAGLQLRDVGTRAGRRPP